MVVIVVLTGRRRRSWLDWIRRRFAGNRAKVIPLTAYRRPQPPPEAA